MRAHRLVLALLTVAAGMLLPATSAPRGFVSAAAPPPAGVASPMPVRYSGRLALAPTHGVPGTVVTATTIGLPPHTELTLVWVTVDGRWVLRGPHNEEYHGREFTPVYRALAKMHTDAAGRGQATFAVPVDFGFIHNVTLVQDGGIRNQAAFSVDPQASTSPHRGPAGTPIQVVLRGVGWRSLENSWMLVYDDKFTGWLSAVTTGGVARAIVPAAGGPGTHIVQIIHGSFTVPYLNMQQSPRPDRPSFTFKFTVTPGTPILPPQAVLQALPAGRGTPPVGPGPLFWTDVVSGPVGTPFHLHGRGLPPGQEVEIVWGTVTGDRVSGRGWSDSAGTVAKAATDPAGAFTIPLRAPDDVGGPHSIAARIGSSVVSETRFILQPSAVRLEPASGPVGTIIKVHLKGVGWTETANIYHVVYDNGYLGYACGFNSQGDVQIRLPAAGAPGWHFIDLYPGIYKGSEIPGVQDFRIPQLTYAADHPGETLPAFRFAFLVTR